MEPPSVGTNVLSAIIHLLGVTILTHLISRRTILRGNLTLRDVSWPRICVLLIFVDSWLFILSSGILILGPGLERNDVSCSMGIFLCIIFYGSSKLLIYTFLCTSLLCILPSPTTKSRTAVRVYLVWQHSPQPRRLQCKAYVLCLVTLSGYLGVVAVLFYGRLPFLGDSRRCSRYFRPHLLPCPRQADVLHRPEEASKHHTINLRFASGFLSPFIPPLIGRNSFVNAFLTGLFLWPVARSSFRNNRIKRLAVRTLWSALIALTTSCVNILILTLMHGRQLGWVCLGSCGADVGSLIQWI